MPSNKIRAFTLEYPELDLELVLPEAKLLARIGGRLARTTKNALQAGHSIAGEQLPWENRSGALSGSVKSKKTKSRDGKVVYAVAPSSSRVSSLSKTARSYYGLMRIHMSGIYHRSAAYRALSKKREVRKLLFKSTHTGANPLAIGTSALDDLIAQCADKVLKAAWNRELKLRKGRG